MMRAGSVGRKDTSERIEFDEDGEEYDVCGDNDWDEKGCTMISHIYVSFDKIIRSIQFGYTENEVLTLSKKYGCPSSEGLSFKIVRLNQDEYVTGLSGSLGYHGGITNLIFHTNRGKHGPCAKDTNPRPKVEVDPSIRDRREFGGFFGSYRSGGITSIGIYVNPPPSSSGMPRG